MFAAVVLAAGQSKRMGQNKLLMRFGVSTVLETILATLSDCGLGDLVVVTGHERERIEPLLSEHTVRSIFNPDYATGEMLSSIQAGLHAMRDDCAAALIVLGDQPLLNASVVRRVLAAHQPGAVIIPTYYHRRGHPILLDRAVWPDVLARPAGNTLREIINARADQIRYVPVDTDAIIRDLDTPEDYRHATELENPTPKSAKGPKSDDCSTSTKSDCATASRGSP